jgi:predicted DNA-binding transcriptional regulator YafY
MVAIVLLLQARGRMTVPELAEHLEASQRTIRRDLEALSMAGVPVYSQRGRGGGWQLLGGHRIDLSGLTASEAQALLLATGPEMATLGPGIARGLAAARRKVLAALPAALRTQVEEAAQTVLVDPARWGPAGAAAPSGDGGAPSDDEEHLDALRTAVSAGRQVEVEYEPPDRPAHRRRLHPHGLVCKRGVWYLMATSPAGLRTYRVSRMCSVQVTDEPVTRPAGFDLSRAWAQVQQGMADRTPSPVVVRADVAHTALRRLRATVGNWWPVEEGPATGGRVRVTMRFASATSAAMELAGFGPTVDVQEPNDVRAQLAAIGSRLVAAYGTVPCDPAGRTGAPSPADSPDGTAVSA